MQHSPIVDNLSDCPRGPAITICRAFLRNFITLQCDLAVNVKLSSLNFEKIERSIVAIKRINMTGTDITGTDMAGNGGFLTRMRRVVGGVIISVPLLFTLNAWAAQVYSPKGVVELFTSQGCSSCPAADKFVTSISHDKDILALAWHVDYWDYLGWEDTFAKPDHADRQRRYSRSFGENQIYTPQAVINGRSHVIGSRGSIIQGVVKEYREQQKGMMVPINTTIHEDVLDIEISYEDSKAKANLWMVYFADEAVVKIERGENHGKDLTYSNIVRDIELVGMMEPDGLKMMLPLKEISRKGHDSCALILQRTTKLGTPGPIIGAVVIRDLKK